MVIQRDHLNDRIKILDNLNAETLKKILNLIFCILNVIHAYNDDQILWYVGTFKDLKSKKVQIV